MSTKQGNIESRPAPKRLHYALWAVLAVGSGLGALLAMHDVSEATAVRGQDIDALLREVPPYPGSYFHALGQSLWVDGRSRIMAHGQTSDSMAKVADRYEALWTSQGFTVRRRESAEEFWVIATATADPADSSVRSIVATQRAADPAAARSTTIIASYAADPSPSSSQVPTSDHCQRISSTAAQDGAVHTEMVFVDCAAPIREVVRFYDAQLHPARRMVTVEPGGGRHDAHIDYRDPKLEVTLLLTEVGQSPPRTTGSLLWRTQSAPAGGGGS